MIDDPSGRIDFDESGAGPTIVLVPGSCSTGAAWRPVIAALAGRYRCVTTSLPGYGGTSERRTSFDPPMAREVEVVETVVRRAAGPRNEPVHLIGHSFGGLVGLAVALRAQVPLASLFIAEAPAPGVLQACDEIESYQAFRDMTERYFSGFQNGEREAIAPMIDFYGGCGTFASWPQRVRDYAVATTSSNILDWQSAYGFLLPPAMLSQLVVPTQVMCGSLSHPAVRRANDLVSRHAPRASFAMIEGAAHFMISSHPEDVADLLARHVNETMADAAG